MKSKFAAFVMLFVAVFVLASCLSTDDDYTYTNDSALSSFKITGGKKYTHLKSSTGADSIVSDTISLSGYKFYIDQVKGEIYNPDSLPCGVDASKLVCTTTGTAGMVLLKSITSDTLGYITSSDSVDFSVDRQLHVYSNSGLAVRKYTVKVNIHKEYPDSFVWRAMPVCDELKSLKAQRTVTVGNKALLFGTDGNETLVFASDGNGWTACTPDFNHSLAAEAYNGVVAKEGKAYLSDEGNIMSTTDGSHWTLMASATGITRLVAASSFRIYGYAADGRLMASADNGTTWEVSTIDDELSLLPNGETAYTAYPVVTNQLTERILFLGTRPSVDKDITIWGKIDEGAEYSDNQPWAYYNVSADNRHTAPQLTGISLVRYDSKVYLFGTNADAKHVYYTSRDNGITWFSDSTFAVPATFADGISAEALPKAVSFAVDSDNVLWLVNAQNGMTWRGRINRLGWKKEQTDFTE